ncbi:hypothetical protein OPT61_g1598 [Boeremia exigua]|uniref:Uncharacterized protein n=1 Tax=Boeremia exigua TaxID=749465 RepID=A0ACC2IPH7_9PLEO|nr:hypothetical protein OPT61_g1598 [Boeremia exigua]
MVNMERISLIPVDTVTELNLALLVSYWIFEQPDEVVRDASISSPNSAWGTPAKALPCKQQVGRILKEPFGLEEESFVHARMGLCYSSKANLSRHSDIPSLAEQLSSLVVSALSLLSASVVSGEEEHPDMPCFNDICWTSWRCWYWRRSTYDNKIGKRCGMPDNVYIPAYDHSQWNTLVWGENYPMSWKSSPGTQGDDIVLEWLMFEAPGTEKPIADDEKDMFFDYKGTGPERAVVAFSQSECSIADDFRQVKLTKLTDITKDAPEWNFAPRLSDFPNEHLNVSSIEVTAYAMERNVFRLYHRNTFNPHNDSTWDLSEPFTVIRAAEERMIKKAASNQNKADNKKLAIGVGVGVGVAWFAAFMVSWYTSAWYQRRALEKKGYLMKIAQSD